MDGLSYAWTTISGGTPAATDVPQTITEEQGTYELRVTNDSTGCFTLNTVVVRANLVAPDALVPSVSPTQLCGATTHADGGASCARPDLP